MQLDWLSVIALNVTPTLLHIIEHLSITIWFGGLQPANRITYKG
jgi:hypothetical protein